MRTAPHPAAFFLLSLSLLLAFSALSSASAAYSPVLVERLPTDFSDFWSTWWLPQSFAISQLFSTVNNLQIEQVSESETVLVLTADERSEYSKTIEGYAAARSKALEAKNWSKDAMVYFYSGKLYEFFGPPGGSVTAYSIYYKEVLPRLQTTLTLSRDALVLANGATNLALEKVLERTAELEYMGAGYQDYAGAAAGPYNEVRDLLVQANNSELEPRAHPDAARRFASVLKASKDVRFAFAKGGTKFEYPLAYAHAINYQLAGEQNLLTLFVGLDRKLRLAEESIESEYENLKYDDERKLELYTKEFSRLQGEEKYSLVDSALVSKLLPYSRIAFNPPAARIRLVSERLDGLGLDDGEDARKSYEAALFTYKLKGRHYAGVAIEELTNSRLLLDEISIELAEAEEDVANLLPVAKDNAARESAATERALAAFSPKTETEAKVKADALALAEKADELLAQAGSTEADGLALSKYVASIGNYEDVRELLSRKSVAAEEKNAKASVALAELREAIKLAEKDGIAVAYEAEQLVLLEAQFKVADAPMLSNIAETASALTSDIHAKASVQYADVLQSHSLLASEFQLISGFMPDDLRDDYSKFLELDQKYFEAGKLADSALGNLAAMRKQFEQIANAVEESKQAVLENLLSLRSSLFMQTDQAPILDVPSNLTLQLELPNELPFGVEGAFALDLPFPYEVSYSDITEQSENIVDAVYSKGKLTLLMNGIGPASLSYVTFSKSAKLAETASVKEEVLSLSPALLRRAKTISFSSDSLDALRARAPLRSQPSKLEAYLDEVPVQVALVSEGTSLFAEALMKDVQEGNHKLRFYFEFESPYSMEQSNREVETVGETTSVSFDLTLASAGEVLEDVPVYFVEASNAALTSKSVSIAGSQEAPASLSILPSLLGAAFSWKARVLMPDSQITYKVQYSFTDLQSYSESLYASLSASPSAFSAYSARFAGIRALMDAGNYKQAVADMLGLQQEISTPVLGNTTMPERFAEELVQFDDDAVQVKAALVTLSELAPTADTSKISTQLREATGAKEEAKMLAAGGKYAEALTKLADARASLEEAPLMKQFSSLRTSLEKAAQDKRAEALKLSTIANSSPVNEQLLEISQVLSQAQGSAAAAEWADAFSLLKNANSSFSLAANSLRASELAAISDFES
ncbi:MAG: hypothetical protein Q7T16_05255, partial [Candidatus Burarchaeum sp.]